MATTHGSEAKTLGTNHDRPASLDNPRSPRRKSRSNFEMYAWLFMRFSGLALVVLVLGHMFIMLMLDEGVHRINFAFVAGRWSSPFWQFWDLTMLWLAQLHGGNGLRTIIADYSENRVVEVDAQGPGHLRHLHLRSQHFGELRELKHPCRNIVMTCSSSAPAAQVCERPSRQGPRPARQH